MLYNANAYVIAFYLINKDVGTNPFKRCIKNSTIIILIKKYIILSITLNYTYIIYYYNSTINIYLNYMGKYRTKNLK